MIQKESYIKIIDNSGGKWAKCIHIYNGYRKRVAKIGDRILISVKQLREKKRSRAKVKEKMLLFSLVVLTTMAIRTKNNIFNIFFQNFGILLNKQFKPFGTRFYIKIPKWFRFSRYFRIVSLAKGLIY